MRRFLMALSLVLIATGCGHTQVTPTSHSATLTVTNAPCTAGTAAATCGYVFSKAVLATGTTSCPSTTGTNYTALNQASPVAQPASGNASYVDASAAGETVCYIGQTCEGSACFTASAAVGPATVEANPLAPDLGTVTTAKNEKPTPAPIQGAAEMALNRAPMQLKLTVR